MKQLAILALGATVALAACGGAAAHDATPATTAATASTTAPAPAPTTETATTDAPTTPAPTTAPKPDEFANGQAVADTLGCGSYTDGKLGSVDVGPKPVSRGVCTTADGVSLSITVYSTVSDRQAAEGLVKVMAPGSMARDAMFVFASGDNVVVAEHSADVATSPAGERAVRAAAKRLDLDVETIRPKS